MNGLSSRSRLSAARRSMPIGFDARVETLRKNIGVPGMAIAVVEDGAVTVAKDQDEAGLADRRF